MQKKGEIDMFNKITEEQIIEIENLPKESFDALAAYGADMYRQGIFKGAACTVCGCLVMDLVLVGFKYVKQKIKCNREES